MTRKYRVTSRTNTLGHPRGEVFTASLSREQEARLIARGSLERVKRSEEKADAGATSQSDSRDSG